MADIFNRRDRAHRFRWLGPGRVPFIYDLRRSGWELDETSDTTRDCVGVLDGGQLGEEERQRILAVPHDLRRFILVVSSAPAVQRAQLLKAGVGEVLSDATEPGEFEARATRLAEMNRSWLPRHRQLGGLQLDLLAREAYGRGQPLNLNPREFALIWRLADTPGEPVSKQNLIQDVWRMGFVPETNSIAVHMSRLRRKLGFAGLSGIIATSAAGGYCLLHSEPASRGARSLGGSAEPAAAAAPAF